MASRHLAYFLLALCLLSANSASWEQDTNSSVLIGNPGTGKSTLLNCYLGVQLFESGISLDSLGITYQLDVREHEGNIYMDTPGLADLVLRQQAAHAIDQALQRGGNFKVIFVMSTEDGRVRPDDLTTMQLVLEAANQVGENQYAIVVNKCKKKFMERFDKKAWVQNLQDAMENRSLPITSFVHFVPVVDDLDEEKNAMVVLDEKTQHFVDIVPQIHIEVQKLHKVNYSQFDDMKRQIALSEMNNKILHDQAQKAEEARLAAEATAESALAAQTEAEEEARKAAEEAKAARKAEEEAQGAQREAEAKVLAAQKDKTKAEEERQQTEKELRDAQAKASQAESEKKVADERAESAKKEAYKKLEDERKVAKEAAAGKAEAVKRLEEVRAESSQAQAREKKIREEAQAKTLALETQLAEKAAAEKRALEAKKAEEKARQAAEKRAQEAKEAAEREERAKKATKEARAIEAQQVLVEFTSTMCSGVDKAVKNENDYLLKAWQNAGYESRGFDFLYHMDGEASTTGPWKWKKVGSYYLHVKPVEFAASANHFGKSGRLYYGWRTSNKNTVDEKAGITYWKPQ